MTQTIDINSALYKFGKMTGVTFQFDPGDNLFSIIFNHGTYEEVNKEYMLQLIEELTNYVNNCEPVKHG